MEAVDMANGKLITWTGTAALRRTAMSKAFGDFAKAAKLPQSLDARMQWLNSAVQTAHQFKEE